MSLDVTSKARNVVASLGWHMTLGVMCQTRAILCWVEATHIKRHSKQTASTCQQQTTGKHQRPVNSDEIATLRRLLWEELAYYGKNSER